LLPVLLSLAVDGDYQIRTGVAWSLRTMPPEEATIAVLVRMLDDESSNVKIGAMYTLRGYGPESAAALPKLRQRMQDADPHLQATAALAVIGIQQDAADAHAVLRDGVGSANFNVRRTCLSGLDMRIQGDEQLFAILVDKSLNDPDGPCQRASLDALRHYGKKAVPHLVAIMTSKSPNRYDAMTVLGMIGPDAREAIPALEDSMGGEYTRHRAEAALQKIDPVRFAKK
jgi:HEAT repeat protein